MEAACHGSPSWPTRNPSAPTLRATYVKGMHRSVLCVWAAVLLSGCFHRVSADRIERHGWHRIHPVGDKDAYDDRFERIAYRLEDVDCATLAKHDTDPAKPIFVMLHGAGGEGVEMKKSVPLLADSRPAAVYVLRWSPWDRRETLVTQLAGGVSRIAHCVPGAPGRIIVVAHSAGGVLASLAAGRVVPPRDAPKSWLTIVTIAAPLSGHLRGGDHGPEPAFMFDLANTPDYPPPAPGVRVLHLRTSVTGDVQMTPIVGHSPNDVRVGVPGAPQIDLPEQLSHAGSLVYVTRLFADGSFHTWLEPRASAVPGDTVQARKPQRGGSSKSHAAGRRGPMKPSLRARSELFQW